MNKALEQSIKAHLRTIAKARDLTFAELWHNLILERFLVRLCQFEYHENFILKGGTLLARYIALGRETRDLDFLVQSLPNEPEPLKKAFDHICSVILEDGFSFEVVKIEKLSHPHMNYTGAQVQLLVKFGGPQAHVQIDLGFGDIVEAIDYPINLIATKKGPLFESKIQVRCYPKEFIFAEKLETVIYRGSGNTRMKDFHDLHSLVSLPGCLDVVNTEKVVVSVFNHRQTSMQLPLRLEPTAIDTLQSLWQAYYQETSPSQTTMPLPKTLTEVVDMINAWLQNNTNLCALNISPPDALQSVHCVYMALGSERLHKSRLISVSADSINALNSSNEHLCYILSFDDASKTWKAKYDHERIYETVLFYVHGDSGRGFVAYNSADRNRTHTKLQRAQLGDVFQLPGYFLNDWNNRIDQSTGQLCYWFQPTETLSPEVRSKLIATAKNKHPYNTFD